MNGYTTTFASISSFKDGHFGKFGGSYVPETLQPQLDALAAAFERYSTDPDFLAELSHLYGNFSGRPTPVFHCANLSRENGGAQIYLKREDLNHLGAHKLNNTLGQMLLAKRMGKTRVVAETGAGQHGVATAATAALLGMECTVFMGEEDMRRQSLNVFRMKLLGAEVVCAESGQRTLKEAVDEALIFWAERADTTFYVLGSAVGPHPYPLMVRTFQSIISVESRRQMLEQTGTLPDACIACVGGGSNAIGMFAAFIDDADVRLIGAEPGGRSLEYGEHAASLCCGKPGVLHGFFSYMLQDEKGEAAPVYSVSAGLDYPGVGPEHSFLKDSKRAEYVPIDDATALAAFTLLARHEGIIPALESSHALAAGLNLARTLPATGKVLVCLSGRGDKDVQQVQELLERV